MKYRKLLCLAASVMLMAGCGNSGGSKSSSGSNPAPTDEEILKNALDGMGTNYTVTWTVVNDEDDYSPQRLFGENFECDRLMYQMCGYGKIAGDKNTYHYYDHYNPNRLDPWLEGDSAKFFNLYGRRDYSDAMLKEDATIANYFDLSKFEKTSETTYRATDAENICTYMDSINGSSMTYYMFGNAHAGIEIELNDDKSLKQINWYGNADDDGNPKDEELYATATYTDVGATTDDIFFSYVADTSKIPEPTNEDLALMGSDGHALYEGETHTFENFYVTHAYGKYQSLVSVDNSYDTFITQSGLYADMGGTVVSFTAEVTSVNGHVELTNLATTEVSPDEYELEDILITEGDGYWWDFGDPTYGVGNTGCILDIENATYQGYDMTEGRLLVHMSYLSCGKFYNFDIDMTAKYKGESDEETEANYQKQAGQYLNAGTTIKSFYGLMFTYENGKPVMYANEDTLNGLGYEGFGDYCLMSILVSVPACSDLMGFEYYFDTSVSGSDDNEYCAVVGCADVYADKADSFVADYTALLTEAGYTLNDSFTDESTNSTVYEYTKDDAVIIFSSPVIDSDYYYTTFEVVNLSLPYDMA